MSPKFERRFDLVKILIIVGIVFVIMACLGYAVARATRPLPQTPPAQQINTDDDYPGGWDDEDCINREKDCPFIVVDPKKPSPKRTTSTVTTGKRGFK